MRYVRHKPKQCRTELNSSRRNWGVQRFCFHSCIIRRASNSLHRTRYIFILQNRARTHTTHHIDRSWQCGMNLAQIAGDQSCVNFYIKIYNSATITHTHTQLPICISVRCALDVDVVGCCVWKMKCSEFKSVGLSNCEAKFCGIWLNSSCSLYNDWCLMIGAIELLSERPFSGNVKARNSQTHSTPCYLMIITNEIFESFIPDINDSLVGRSNVSRSIFQTTVCVAKITAQSARS